VLATVGVVQGQAEIVCSPVDDPFGARLGPPGGVFADEVPDQGFTVVSSMELVKLSV